MLIGMESLAEIVETAMHTPYIKDAIPISIILIGQSGAGKSKLIMQYRETPGVHITSDVTSMGLQTLMRLDHKNEMRSIIVPDFNVILSHKTSTLNLTVANLLSVTSEGIIRIDDGREQKETKHAPINIITAMTRDLYITVAKRWQVLGFSRRILPIFYEYSLQTRMLVQDSIQAGLTNLRQLTPRSVFKQLMVAEYEVVIEEKHGGQMRLFSETLAEHIGWVPYYLNKPRGKKAAEENKTSESTPKRQDRKVFTGKQLEFSPHMVLRSMAQAHALRDGRTIVTEDDYYFLLNLLKFTKFDRPGEI